MDFKDYYATLGVERSATAAEIKKAYRRLARQLHPDAAPGDAEAERRFKEINEAHAVLSDPAKRARYDQLGSDWRSQPQSGFGAAWTTESVGDSADDLGGFSDFFRVFFGAGSDSPFSGGPGFSVQRRPRDVTAETQVSLAEVMRGAERIVEVDGRRLHVRIPSGINDRSRIKLSGGGLAGTDGTRGDLLVSVRIADEPGFERRGADLHADLSLPLATALLGGKIRVPTPVGSFTLRVRPNTANGQLIRVPGRGLPRRSGSAGDLLLRVSVVLPVLDEEERRAFARWQVELDQGLAAADDKQPGAGQRGTAARKGDAVKKATSD